MPESGPNVIAWETTRRCALNCRHCRGAARDAEYAGELSTREGFRLIDALAAVRPLLILTGGDPLSRDDIYELAHYASGLGLRVVAAPCGDRLTPETSRRLLASGVRRISVSLDGKNAETHDAFRGRPGAFEGALRGLRCAREAGLEFQINTTVSRHTVDQLPAMLELAAGLGAAALDFFFLVPTGRGAALRDLALPPEDYERALRWIAAMAAKGATLPLKTTCAPQYARLAKKTTGHAGPPVGRPARGGCLAGREFVFISHRGHLQPCGFLDVSCGDLRAAGFDFRALYENSAVFKALRRTEAYRGPCGACEFLGVCGGCRARAYAEHGDYLGSDPACALHPT